MNFIADFHIHSKYSRATARNLDFENLYINAQIKGIKVLGTGDFTHPAWWQEIQNKLIPAEDGLFQLKPDIARICDEKVPSVCKGTVRFMLVTEISNIYKKKGRTRKNHNLVFMPDMDKVEQFNRRLDRIGNIQSDGRPILGLDARDLLEIILETDDNGFLVPAHIWTPWFSLLGSKSGFDAVEECFEDLTSHIFALETGLSSDPPMNWRVSHLDRYTLISNSDAHSPSKLGREANQFNTALGFGAIRRAMETADPNQFLGTIEFYPEEGKYHVDGHRKCGFRSDPTKTRELGGICPVCGKALTLGVLYRVQELSDRNEKQASMQHRPYRNLIPLESVLSEVLQVGVKTKKVSRSYHQLIQTIGSEFEILCNTPREILEKSNIPLLAEAIVRMRQGNIVFNPGYDGEFGRVRIFDSSEREQLQGQQVLFDLPKGPTGQINKLKQRESKKNKIIPLSSKKFSKTKALNASAPNLETHSTDFKLNLEQQAAVDKTNGPLLICAGPGTGKTRTITFRMAALIKTGDVPAERILAITFTNKAAHEMRDRLEKMLAANSKLPLVATFHGFCWQLIKERYEGKACAIVDERERRSFIRDAVMIIENTGVNITLSTETLEDMIIQAKQQMLGPSDDLEGVTTGRDLSQLAVVYAEYQKLIAFQDLFDFEDLLFHAVKYLEEDKAWRDILQKRFNHFFVDEFQDINDAQYRLLRALAPKEANVCVIGDPDQAIYGFRGSDVRYFKHFVDDYKQCQVIQLVRNYRSTEAILTSSFQLIQNHRVKLSHSDNDARIYSNIQGKRFISVLESSSSKAEAVFIGRIIEQMVGGMAFESIYFEKVNYDKIESECGFDDFAVLCRTSDQVQNIARQLISAGIPCQMVSRRLLEQPTVAQLLAAFRVVTSQGTYPDLDYLTKLSASGIRKETLNIFKQWAYARQLPLSKALHSAFRLPIMNMSTARQQRLAELIRLLKKVEKGCEHLSAAETLIYIANQTTLHSKIEEDALDRLAALAMPFGNDNKAFCSALAIDRDTDLYQPKAAKVAVMTLHASKGLEFPVVFIAGCENNILPYHRPGKEDIDIEEERRLLYVGMTRARQKLFLSWASKRTIYGKRHMQQRSFFVDDINEKLRKHIVFSPKFKKPKHEQLSLF